MSYRSLRWLGWVPVAVFINQFVCTVKVVTGGSMKPTLNPDTSLWRDILVFDRTVVTSKAYKFERGDIVAFRSPIDANAILVKRIVALGGDEVKTLHPYPEPISKVPEGYMWVEGDERFHTRDSNYFGPSLIDSKATFIIWPPARFGDIHSSSARALARVPILSTAWKLERDAAAREAWRKRRVRTPHNE